MLSQAQARLLCYALGPVSSAFILNFGPYSHLWSVRFHAFHSLLVAAFWAVNWLALRLLEAVSPWFLSTVFRQVRFAVNLGFVFVWILLLISAWQGSRFVVLPWLHELAVRLGRYWERRPVRA